MITAESRAIDLRRYSVVAVCFAAIVFDGYDLIIYGSTIPALLSYQEWSLSQEQIGAIGSAALLGMFFGAISVGTLTHRLGHRKVFLGCLIWYSLAMIGVALAPNPGILAFFRFVAGLGFGGIAPVAIAMVVEIARPHERNRLNAMMLAGLPVGGVIAAFLALNLQSTLGFRGLWAIGALALAVVVPFAWRFIPETVSLEPTLNVSEAPTTLRSYSRDRPFSRGLRAVVMFASANFIGFLLVFGLNTWLPQLMREAGYSVGSALTFQLLLNGGAVTGGVFGSALADRFGSRTVAAASFVVASVAVAAMGMAPSQAVMYLVVLLAGAGSIGTQIVLSGYVANYYPTHVRASALGLTTGIGRLGAVSGPLVGGALLGGNVPFSWIFVTFGAIAMLGGIVCLAVPPSDQRAVVE